MFYTIIDRRDTVRPFSWQAAIDHIESQLDRHYVANGTYVRSVDAWKSRHIDAVFVPLNPTHQELPSGQLFELKPIPDMESTNESIG